MFQVNDYVFYGRSGVCRIVDLCTEPFDGAPRGVLYYVLHTLSEPKQIIWNPVSNDKVYMRHVMSASEAEAYFALLPALPVLEGDSAKQLRDTYMNAVKSGDPILWGRVMRTYKARVRLAQARLTHVTDAERNFYESARKLLATEIALALSISESEIEKRLTEMLDERIF